MGKSKGLNLPATPQYTEDSNLSPNITFGSEYNKGLLSGNFTGDRAWLQSLVNPNNSANALSYAQSTLSPQFRQNNLDLTNQLAATGSLNSSTASDAYSKMTGDLNTAYQAIVSQQAIRDSEQANANKLGLLQTGEQGLNAFTGAAQSRSNAQNQFNLENYNNQVAAALAGQKQSNGGLMGGLTGAAGGAMAGSFLGPLGVAGGALLGGLAGGFTPQSSNFGGNILSSGAGLLGSSMQAKAIGGLEGALRSGQSAFMPGQYATNTLSLNSSNPELSKYFNPW